MCIRKEEVRKEVGLVKKNSKIRCSGLCDIRRMCNKFGNVCGIVKCYRIFYLPFNLFIISSVNVCFLIRNYVCRGLNQCLISARTVVWIRSVTVTKITKSEKLPLWYSRYVTGYYCVTSLRWCEPCAFQTKQMESGGSGGGHVFESRSRDPCRGWIS